MGSRARRRPPAAARLAAILIVLAAGAVVVFLIACPPSAGSRARQATGQRAPEQSPRAPEIEVVPQRPRPEEGLLSVVIDDAGYSLQELQEFLDLPGPLTVAVLPNLPHSTEAAQRILSAGKNLILHCPMEPVGGENPGPGALYVGQSPQQIESLLADAFASVPGSVGMNNHMGSRATTDDALMTIVLGYLKREGKYYLDSRTTADTVGPRIAGQLGVSFLERDVFVDVDTAPSEVDAAFAKGIEEARSRGSAILIGHVQNKAVADILRVRVRDLPGMGVRLARLEEVMQAREGSAAR